MRQTGDNMKATKIRGSKNLYLVESDMRIMVISIKPGEKIEDVYVYAPVSGTAFVTHFFASAARTKNWMIYADFSGQEFSRAYILRRARAIAAVEITHGH